MIVTNCLILREEGFLACEISIIVGSDGSMQHAKSPERSVVMYCPATIPHREIQLAVLKCLERVLKRLDADEAAGLAVMQAKAKHDYVFKRTMVRNGISTEHP